MNITLLIHGVPMGFNTWKSDDSDYLKRFYRKSDKNEEITVEVISTESGPATFYNYLRYNTIVDANGRAGSYYGMSIRIDGYECMKIADIYYLMQAVFNNHVIPAVFNVDNGIFRYKYERFTSLDGVLSELENNILRALLSFTNIDRDYAILPQSLPIVTKSCEINPEDLTDNDASLLTKGVRVIVSNYVATRRTKAYEDKIKELNQSLLVARSKSDEEQKNYEDKISKLNESLRLASINANGDQIVKIKKLSDDNAALRQEIDRLKMELSEYRSGGFNPTPHDPHGNDKLKNLIRKDLKKISVLLGIVIVFILLLVIPRNCNSASDITEELEPDPRPYPQPDPEPYPQPDPRPYPQPDPQPHPFELNFDEYFLDVVPFNDGTNRYKIRLHDIKDGTNIDINTIPGLNIRADKIDISSTGVVDITNPDCVRFDVWIDKGDGNKYLNRTLSIINGYLCNSRGRRIKE